MAKTERIEENNDLAILKSDLLDEILKDLESLANRNSFLEDIQPTSSILLAASVAATEVFIAFERGYRMGG